VAAYVVWAGVGAPSSTTSTSLSTANLYTDKGTKHTFLEQLLDIYQDVFVEPEGLPPAKACDHEFT
jgi:hypothetical protein